MEPNTNLKQIAQSIIDAAVCQHGEKIQNALYSILQYTIQQPKQRYITATQTPLVNCHRQQTTLVHRSNKIRSSSSKHSPSNHFSSSSSPSSKSLSSTHRHGLLVGTLNGTQLPSDHPSINQPTLTNPYPALITYILLKQGTLTLQNVAHPYNQPTLNHLHQSSPDLHKLLTTDHYTNTLTLAQLMADPTSLTPLDPTNPTSAVHPTHTSLPATHVLPMPDNMAQQLVDTAAPTPSTTLLQHLDTLLRWMATLPPVDRLPERLHFTLNPLHTSTPTATLTHYSTAPRVFVNDLNHKHPLATVSLLRPLLAASIGRPDLWQGWRGDSDKRYYAVDKRGYCTRGNYNKVFGYALRRLEIALVDHPQHTLNPYELLHIATTILEEEKPFLRPATYNNPHPSAIDRLLATPRFNVVHHEWLTADITSASSYDAYLASLEAESTDTLTSSINDNS